MGKVLRMTYASSLTNLCELNSSFDTGILRIAYPGVNRNKSCISKDVFEKCVNTMYNCPVVCNYDVETDAFGGHDMKLIRDGDGALRVINVTSPIGVICESANHWWEVVQEDDGTEHEYLFTEVLLWKRQAAYQKIKRDGVSAHSMEINVKSGELIDGIYNVYDFEFTAFAIIGTEPCFEGSALEVFSTVDFKQQLSEMMREFKESFNLVNASAEGDNISKNEHAAEGGKDLEEKVQLAAKYGFEIDSLDFSLEDFTIDELREKFEVLKDTNPSEGESDGGAKYSLLGNLVEETRRVLGEETITNEWGTYPRYCYADCDPDLSEVYCWDANDWLLYGFNFTVNGDSVAIDYNSRKRKKYIIADFNEGEQDSPFESVFEQMKQKMERDAQDVIEITSKYESAKETVNSMSKEIVELRQFKADTENAIAADERKELLEKFSDLAGIDAYEELCQNSMEYSLEALEEKCYAVRGKYGVPAKYSLEEKAPKLKVERTEAQDEPYGGLFVKYNRETK